MTAKTESRIFILSALVLALAAYLGTLCRGIYAGDAGELAVAASLLQIAHPPGYPLLTNLGHIWVKLLFWMRPIMALNIFSAAAMAASAAVLYTLLESVFTPRHWKDRLILLAGTLIFAGSITAWTYAAAFEVYSLSALFAVILLLLIARCFERWDERTILLICFIFGLSLCNHLSILSLAPAIVLLLFRHRDQLTVMTLAKCVALTAFALTLYLYLPIRSVQELILDWNDPSSLQGFQDQIMAKDYRRFIAIPYLSDIPVYLQWLGAMIWEQHAAPIFVIALPGMFLTIRKNRYLGLALLCVVACNLTLNFFYLIPDLDPYFLPTFLVFAIWVTESIIWLANQARTRVLVVPVAVVVIFVAGFNFAKCDISQRIEGESYGRALLRQVPTSGVLFCGGDLTLFPSLYLRYVENVRTDCEVYGYGLTATRLKRDWNLSDTLLDGGALALMRACVQKIDRPLVLAREMVYVANNPNDLIPSLHEADLLYCRDSCAAPHRASLANLDDIPQIRDPMIGAVFLTEILLAADQLKNVDDQARNELLSKAERLVNQFPRSTLFNSFADYLVTHGDFSRAYRVLKEGLANTVLRERQMMRILPLWASVNLEMGNSQEAESTYQRIVAFDSENVVARYSLLMLSGEKAARAGQIDDALAKYQSASELMPDVPEVRFRLGQLYLKKGNKAIAQQMLNSCIDAGYRVEESRSMLLQAAQ